MSDEMIWVVALVVVAVAAVVGYFVGRSGHAGAQERIAELETEVKLGKEEFGEYKKEVEAHFDKSASLFVDMAGSYKALFEHLSSDYEKLSEGSARELFKERVGALLMDGDPPKALASESAEPTTQESATDVAQVKPNQASAVDAPTRSDGESEVVVAQAEAEAPKAETDNASAATKPEAVSDAAKDTGVAASEEATAEAAVKEAEAKSAEAADVTPADDSAAAKAPEVQPSDKTPPEAETTLEKASRKRHEADAAAAAAEKGKD